MYANPGLTPIRATRVHLNPLLVTSWIPAPFTLDDNWTHQTSSDCACLALQ